MADDASLQPWVEAGIFNPADEGAEQLRELLEFYNSLGVDPSEYEGVEPRDLLSSVNIGILRPGRRFDATEARESAGLDKATFEHLCRSAGYALDGQFTELDVQALHGFAAAAPLFSEEAINNFARALTAAMARVADATTSLFRINIAAQIDATGGGDLEYARKNQEVVDLIEPLMTAMRAFFLNQLTGAVHLGDEGRRASTTDDITTIRVAVGFVDIVGYTQLSTALPPDDLAAFIDDFEARASGLVTACGGRLVKMIGDAVMFVAVEPAEAIDVASAILDAFEGTAAQPRAGLAYGEIIGLAGDYYGEVVNLASRISDQALPGEVLVDEATTREATSRSFDAAGRRQLKGFSDPVALFTLRG